MSRWVKWSRDFSFTLSPIRHGQNTKTISDSGLAISRRSSLIFFCFIFHTSIYISIPETMKWNQFFCLDCSEWKAASFHESNFCSDDQHLYRVNKSDTNVVQKASLVLFLCSVVYLGLSTFTVKSVFLGLLI